MFGFIYQIMWDGYKPEERIGEDAFYDHLDDLPADYVREMDEDDELKEMSRLDNFLPKSMFERNGREVTFKGVGREAIAAWKQRALDCLNAASVDDIASGNYSWHYLQDINYAVNDIFGKVDESNIRFYTNENGYSEKSTEFFFGCMQLKPGDKFYIGAVIGFHY